MTKKPTIYQKNRAIHEFMKGQYTIIADTPGGHISRIDFISTSWKDCYIKSRGANKFGELKYKVVPKLKEYRFHYLKSWEALMPVVQKIARLMARKEWKNLPAAKYRWKAIHPYLIRADISKSAASIYEFIKWYNTIKNN